MFMIMLLVQEDEEIAPITETLPCVTIRNPPSPEIFIGVSNVLILRHTGLWNFAIRFGGIGWKYVQEEDLKSKPSAR